MSYLGNTPGQSTVIVVEARKSFALALWLKDPHGKPVNLAGCSLTIVAKREPVGPTDATNILATNATANIPVPVAGYAIFNIQAASLDQAPGEYPYAIVLKTPDGYTSVIVKGVLDIQQNTEWASAGISYSSANPPQSLEATMRQNNSIDVYIGSQLPPGMSYVREDVVEAIETFDPDAIAYVPEGGTIGYVLTKTSSNDYEMDWRPRENGPFGLDATGQPANYVPAALGDGTWDWAAVGIDATGIAPGRAPVSNGDGTWSWANVTVPKPDWNATPGTAAEILNKPSLGTAAAKNVEEFMDADTLVSAMPGVHFVTSVPVSGTDGHLYFVYTP